MLQKQGIEDFLELTPDAVIIFTTEGKLLSVNQKTEALFGYKSEELIGKSIEILFSDEVTGMKIGNITELFKTSIPKDGFRLSGKRKNQVEFYAELSINLDPTQQGKNVIFGTVRDITTRIKTEQDFQQVKNLFQRIFESSLQGILKLEVILNRTSEVEDFRYTLINDQAEKYLGLKREKDIGKRVGENIVSFQSSERFKILKKVYETGIPEVRELCVDVNGEPKWFKGSWVKLDNSVVLTFDDISERITAEQKISELNSELEKRVAERTEELTSTNERLKSINEKLDKYAYFISHDIKAPVNNILGLADLIKEDYQNKPLNEEGRQLMDLIMNKCEDIKSIIDNLLQTAKDEIKSKEEINLNSLAEEVIHTLNPPSHFHFFIQHNLPKITFARPSFLQILQNLFSNAIKYMDKENPLISLGCVDNKDSYLLCVSDNGPGIPEEKKQSIFNLFEIAHDGESQLESHGIGLSIVKQLVEENGGKIWIESKVGKGSKFHFTILK